MNRPPGIGDRTAAQLQNLRFLFRSLIEEGIVFRDQRFDRPVVLPDGKTLRALEDARQHILTLPKPQQETTACQIAIEALLVAADSRSQFTKRDEIRRREPVDQKKARQTDLQRPAPAVIVVGGVG